MVYRAVWCDVTAVVHLEAGDHRKPLGWHFLTGHVLAPGAMVPPLTHHLVLRRADTIPRRVRAGARLNVAALRGLQDRSTRSVYFVAEGDPAKAEAIVAAMMAPNERVEAWGPLPEAAVKAPGLKPGDFMHW